MNASVLVAACVCVAIALSVPFVLNRRCKRRAPHVHVHTHGAQERHFEIVDGNKHETTIDDDGRKTLRTTPLPDVAKKPAAKVKGKTYPAKPKSAARKKSAAKKAASKRKKASK